MNDEDMLAALAAAERAQGPAPEWEALARGEIEEDEAVRRARERGADEAEIDRAKQLFAPRSAQYDDAIADRLLAGAPAAQPEPRVVELPRRSASS